MIANDEMNIVFKSKRNKLNYNKLTLNYPEKSRKYLNAHGLCNGTIEATAKYLGIFMETCFLQICGLVAGEHDLRLFSTNSNVSNYFKTCINVCI